MSTHLTFILILEALGLVLVIVALWSLWWNKKHQNTRRIDAALESHLHGMLTAELEIVEKELKKAVAAAGKDAVASLQTNHAELNAQSHKLLEEFAHSFKTEMSSILKEEHDEIASLFKEKGVEIIKELESYKQQKISDLDKNSELLLTKLLQRKVWRSVQTTDPHAIAKQAVQEIVASGELSS